MPSTNKKKIRRIQKQKEQMNVENELSTQQDDHILSKPNNIYIKRSTILNAGNGVFTLRDFEKGEYICTYGGTDTNTINCEKDFRYSLFTPSNSSFKYRVGFTNNTCDFGQFINDGYYFELSDSYRDDNSIFRVNDPKIKNAIDIYTKESKIKENVVFMDNKFRLCAKRFIKKGEELFLSYGIQYWLTINTITTDEPLTRLSCLILNDVIKLDNYNNLIFDDKIVEDYNKFLKEVLRILPNGRMINALQINHFTDKQKVFFLLKLVM